MTRKGGIIIIVSDDGNISVNILPQTQLAIAELITGLEMFKHNVIKSSISGAKSGFDAKSFAERLGK